MLSEDIQSLVTLQNQHPENIGMLKAVFALLEKASDSAVITEAFNNIIQPDALDEATRAQALLLLNNAGADDLVKQWSLEKERVPANPNDLIRLNNDLQIEWDKPTGTKLEDIGGLHDVKVQIRRKIIKPFENPSLFQKFKRRAGGGVLMYGPPGCGKTLLAKAVASECNAHFIEVRASDVLDQYMGNAEKRIASIFKEAREKLPAVLFFDEIEALAQRRQYGHTGHINTIISTLLSEMDGLSKQDEGLLFLGATNVPWAIDAAFRRPGRFDRTIFIPPPDKVARGFILNQLLKDRPVKDHLDTTKIVGQSAGFSGADLEALVDTAVDFALDESESEENYIALDNQHFAQALKEVRASTGEWLAQAKSYTEYANHDGLYNDLRDFLRKHT